MPSRQPLQSHLFSELAAEPVDVIQAFADQFSTRSCPADTKDAASPVSWSTGARDALASLDRFECAWRELGETQGGLTGQYDWVAACAFDTPALDLLTVGSSGQIDAVAPLARVRRRGVLRLEMLGVSRHFEPTEILERSETALKRLCDAVVNRGLAFHFGRVPAGSPSVKAIGHAIQGRGLLRVQPVAAVPWIALDPSWESPEQHLNSGRRSDLRRARRRAEELGPVTFELVHPQEAELSRLLDEAFEVERRSWKGEAETALACDTSRGDFFRRYALRACRQGTLRLCFLRIAGIPVAMQIAIEQSRRFWLLKVGYDSAYAKCSPGMLLTRETIAYAARNRLLSYEFLGRCEPWTEVWTSLQRPCVSIDVYPWSVSGLSALVVDGTVAALLRTKQVFARLRQRLTNAMKTGIQKVVTRAARRYVAGELLEDAVRVRESVDRAGEQTTLGFWDGEGDSPRAIADQYLAAIDSMNGLPGHAYVSIKLPSLKGGAELLEQVAARAEATGCRLHFDALSPESVDSTKSAIEALRRRHPSLQLGFTLPGRWTRSVSDADWVVKNQLAVRVVKGQFAAIPEQESDPRQGFLRVVERLAGRAAHVDIATHDEPLALECCDILRVAGTPFDRERLFGMGGQPSPIHNSHGKSRVYIPYGAAYLPYAVSRLRKNPGIALRLARDWVRSVFRRPSGINR